MLKNFFKILIKRKITFGIIIILLIVGGYFGYKALKGNTTAVHYVSATVERGTLISSVSGSGQISASNQVDLKAKALGDAIYVNASVGQEVKTGAVLVQLNTIDAQRTARDAEANLENAKLTLEKLQAPSDAYSILQAENSLASSRDSLEKLKLSQQTDYQKAVEAKENAESDFAKAYDDGFNTIANTFLDLPTVMAGLNDILFGYNFSIGQWNMDYYANMVETYDIKAVQYKTDAYNKYQLARQSYDKSYQDYKSASRFSEKTVIDSLINETYETTRNIAEAVKSTNNLIQFYKDELIKHDLRPQALADTHLSSLNTYTSKTNSHLLDLLGIKDTIKQSQESILNAQRSLEEMEQNNPLDLSAAERSVQEREASLAKLKTGPDALDVKSQELSIKQKEEAFSDAKAKLADYSIRAPFDGVIATVDVKKGDSVSSGTAIATIITKQRTAKISLNEVDVAKVKTGQKVTLTFDAVEDLSLTGEVAEVDTLGTVTQGVVNYGVKIIFDTQDERIKPGMSVSATIITEVKQDVLLVPNAAVKSQGNQYYVETIPATAANSTSNASAIIPTQKTVEIGLVNDAYTEITNGLSEGDVVVTQTVSSTSSSTATTTTNRASTFSIPGIGGGGGGMRD